MRGQCPHLVLGGVEGIFTEGELFCVKGQERADRIGLCLERVHAKRAHSGLFQRGTKGLKVKPRHIFHTRQKRFGDHHGTSFFTYNIYYTSSIPMPSVFVNKFLQKRG